MFQAQGTLGDKAEGLETAMGGTSNCLCLSTGFPKEEAGESAESRTERVFGHVKSCFSFCSARSHESVKPYKEESRLGLFLRRIILAIICVMSGIGDLGGRRPVGR